MSERETDGHDTPEQAALAGWDSRYARVDGVSYSAKGRKARVKLLTNEEPYLYPYYVHCERDANGRWHETYSSN